ncbi:MAG: 4-hydroxy-3-methylbut-2-enyl diphosphate reductase [Muribaculaceae bacterium]|nr:4-hydroxy-3-methylbut-2-enyl diphosphate reductase [Muribaculaceae bacterium]
MSVTQLTSPTKDIVIEIDPGSGFCFGVVTAINKAEEELSNGGVLYCLGDIVHNSAEVERLASAGLKTIDREQFEHLTNVRVLLRAHGEPPSTYAYANSHSIQLIDATCPVVLKLQQRIKAAYDQAISSNSALQILIYGQRGHAEVNGLVGQTQGTAIVIESLEDLKNVDFDKDIVLYSQTTKSLEGFSSIISAIKCRISPNTHFEHYDTICRQVANRVSNIQEFARTHDAVLFVTDSKSSNGHVLYEHCKSVNPNTHKISRSNDLSLSMIQGAKSIGVCGATSTPRWLMEQVAEQVVKLSQNQ